MVVETALGADAARSFRPGWLFSPRADLGMIGLPALATVVAAILAHRAGHDSADVERAYATWLSQFVFGNTTHVILTFLLLGVRREMLNPTKGQARTVIVGSSVTFAVSLSIFFVVSRLFPFWSDFWFAIGFVFATHHAFSQVKGLWSLYNLRGKALDIPPPSAAERAAQRWFVPLALVLVTARLMFVPKAHWAMFPFVPSVPGEPAFLPFQVTHGLVAVWLVFVGYLFRALLSAKGPKSFPKLVYLGCHSLGVLAILLAPGWGSTFTSGVHGLEYYLLTARMLRPLDTERGSRLGASLVWPALVGAMLPLFVVGLVNAPFTAYLHLPPSLSPAFSVARWVATSIVFAHYFSDAFIYRFRIPEVRKVALARLGFAP